MLTIGKGDAGDRLARGLIGDVLHNYNGALSSESLVEAGQMVLDVLREAGFVLSAYSSSAREVQGAWVEAKASEAIKRWAETADPRDPKYAGYIHAKRRREGQS